MASVSASRDRRCAPGQPDWRLLSRAELDAAGPDPTEIGPSHVEQQVNYAGSALKPQSRQTEASSKCFGRFFHRPLNVIDAASAEFGCAMTR